MEDLHNIGVSKDSFNTGSAKDKGKRRINWTRLRLRASVHQMISLRERGGQATKGEKTLAIPVVYKGCIFRI